MSNSGRARPRPSAVRGIAQLQKLLKATSAEAQPWPTIFASCRREAQFSISTPVTTQQGIIGDPFLSSQGVGGRQGSKAHRKLAKEKREILNWDSICVNTKVLKLLRGDGD